MPLCNVNNLHLRCLLSSRLHWNRMNEPGTIWVIHVHSNEHTFVPCELGKINYYYFKTTETQGKQTNSQLCIYAHAWCVQGWHISMLTCGAWNYALTHINTGVHDLRNRPGTYQTPKTEKYLLDTKHQTATCSGSMTCSYWWTNMLRQHWASKRQHTKHT